MTVVVEWLQPLPQKKASRVESLIKDPKMTHSEIQDVMKISSESLTCILHNCLADGNGLPVGCPIT